jgi:hypothetical protein
MHECTHAFPQNRALFFPAFADKLYGLKYRNIWQHPE